MAKSRTTTFGLGLLTACLLGGQVQATVIDVVIDTSSLTDPTDAVLAFDLTNGDTVAHQVTIDNFMSSGGLLVCPAPDTCPAGALFPDSPVIDPAGSHITGTLPGPLTMYDDDGLAFITYFQNITLGGTGSYISFSFEFLGDPPGTGSDGLQFSLLDTNLSPLLTDTGGALLLYSFGSEPVCDVFWFGVTKCAPVEQPTVPEPQPFALILAGLFAYGVLRLPGRSRLRRFRPAPSRKGGIFEARSNSH